VSFLGALADQISSQYSIGENTNNTLDAVIDGQNVKYGSLGDFSNQFDHSAERSYVEEGYLRQDPYNTTPKQFEILTQEPNATVLVKKRMFSTIAENFNPTFMDADEKLYYRTIKILFQNKCNQIANLEKLSKIQKVTSIIGQIDNYMIPLILSLTDSFSKDFADSNLTKEGDGDNLVKVVDRLRRIYSYNITSPATSWIVDNNNLRKSQYAEGTGVIELTNFTNISTNVSVDMNDSGSCGFNIVDPYGVMLITDYDIERAIADSTNLFYKSKTFQLGKESADTLINELEVRLNQYRSIRGASPISFKINPDTLLGKRVVAIIDRQGLSIPFTFDAIGSALTLGFKGGANVGVEVPPEYLKDGAIAGFDGLDSQKKKSVNGVNMVMPDSELNLFCRLVKTIFDKLSLMANSNNAFQTANKQTNYTRRKLRFNFLGKLIIQPQDSIHVYMTSKSKFDNNLLGGLSNMFNGLGFLQNTMQSLTDLKNSFDVIFNPKANVDLQIEKAAFVGKEFPTWLWNMVRSQFVSENEGIHVFGGLVETASDSWRDGKFSVDVHCKDNSLYFEQGKINFKPGTDTFNGSIYDPLTPFKSNFDTITSNAKSDSPELLEENKWLLSNGGFDSPLIKHKQGPSYGLPLTEKSIIQDAGIDPMTGLLTKTFYAPDGLVYKWKEGIGTLVQFGSSTDFNGPNRVGAPNLAKDPFAGQDVMNVLSLLITGIPYNFTTYWKAIGAPNYSGDPNANQNAASTYYESIRTTLSKNNILWGNFIPFKSLSVDEATYAKKLQGQFDIINQNNQLNSNLLKLQDVYDRMKQFNTIDILRKSNVSGQIENTDTEYQKLKADATNLETSINNLILDSRKNNAAYNSVGDDVSFDVSDDVDSYLNSSDNSTEKNNASKAAFRRKLRRQLNYLTRRMSYNVRANDDKNLFIVDDQYDKDYDIAAYNNSVGEKPNMYSMGNAFTSVKDNIKNTASLLNLEIFCDTQGHVRVRPPQYNRMPSSVFYKMMYMKETLGVQVFPQFLSDLFTNQLETLRLQTEIIEDYIRLNCAILGYNDDAGVYTFMSQYTSELGNGEITSFRFISNTDGVVINIEDIVKNANPDIKSGDHGLEVFSSISQQAKSTQNIFKTSDRAQAIVTVLQGKTLNMAGYNISDVKSVEENSRAKMIADRIFDRTGEKVNINNYLSKRNLIIGDAVQTSNYSIDIFKVLNELSKMISERQKTVKLFYSTIKNYSEYKSLDDKDDKTGNMLLAPGNYGNSNIPEVFEHMIEDETYDDLGPGSGSRYVIKRSQIKDMSFTEQCPQYTSVEVQGTIDYLSADKFPSVLNVFPNGGNAMTTAMAIDYDMWRNYGFKSQATIQAPFLKDPHTQCVPFASMVLSRARKEVLRGNITISGNEYMQPGEVIYLEDRGLLFYVSSVRHNFSFGSGFTTALTLTYGHAPGEYIPTTLDVMGKMLFNNRDLNNIIIHRQESSANESSLGIIELDPVAKIAVNNKTTTKANETIYNTQNLRTINNILYTAQQFINNNASNTDTQSRITRVELRLYYDKDSKDVDSDLLEFAGIIKETLRGQKDLGAVASYDPSAKAYAPWLWDIRALVIQPINLSDVNSPQSPSQKAINASRDLISVINSSDSSTTSDKTKKNQLRSALFKYIVDCWLVYEDTPQVGS
jgi:hypothetical protein